MKFSFGVDMILYFMVILAVLISLTSAVGGSVRNRRVRGSSENKNKDRRGGTSGLFAFPRVGRSDPSLTDSVYESIFPVSYEEYDDQPVQRLGHAEINLPEWVKKGRISPKKELADLEDIHFPRSERSDSELRKWARMAALQKSLDKRTAPSANSGLWFGPRLGRIQKRSADDNEHL